MGNIKIDFNKYRLNYDNIRAMVDKNHEGDLDKTISSIAVATHIPLIVVYTYAKEMLNTEAFDATIRSLITFYGYDL